MFGYREDSWRSPEKGGDRKGWKMETEATSVAYLRVPTPSPAGRTDRRLEYRLTTVSR